MARQKALIIGSRLDDKLAKRMFAFAAMHDEELSP
jgi:hypothetical protein